MTFDTTNTITNEYDINTAGSKKMRSRALQDQFTVEFGETTFKKIAA